MSFVKQFFRRDTNKINPYNALGYGIKREDVVINPYLIKTGANIIHYHPQQLMYMALHDPIAYRITYGVARDSVSAWFDIMTREKKLHKENAEIQEELQLHKANREIFLLAAYGLITGRSWLIRTGEGENWYAIGAHMLHDSNADSFDENGTPISIDVDLEFTTKKRVLVPKHIDPENYLFFQPNPYNVSSHGVSILEICGEDLKFIWSIRRDTAERIRKYAGFPWIQLTNASDPLIKRYQQRYGNFDKLKEVWTDDKMTIQMLGLEGTALNPDIYYKPFIEQISIATGIPIPILRGMESGQLKSGQINLSSYFNVISNLQFSLNPAMETMIGWTSAGVGVMDEAYIRWNLDYAYSDVDRAAIQEIQVNSAVALRDYITDEAFARLLQDLGITKKDVRNIEEVNKPFGNPFEPNFNPDEDKRMPVSNAGFPMNPETEKIGREKTEKMQGAVKTNAS